MVVRNGIKNEDALRLSVHKLAESVGQPAAYNRIANLVKAAGASTTTASVQDYVRFMRESCFVFSIPNLAAKFAERESVKKHYFIDNGLLNIFLTNPESALLENACALQLHRKYGDGVAFYRQNVEVDFYLPENGLAVQDGYCDYVLFGRDNRPLAVVEAKKTIENSDKGRQQVRLYGDCLQRQYGVKPVLYYTNGHDIWVDDRIYPERRVAAFHALDDLERLVQRQTRGRIEDMRPDPGIAGRPYQLTAVKALAPAMAANRIFLSSRSLASSSGYTEYLL